MSIQRISTLILISFGGSLLLAPSAQAADFKTNVSYSNYPQNISQGDIWLQSITQKDKQGKDQTFSNFSFVNRVNILENDQKTQNTLGAASTDRGDKASKPKGIEVEENPDAKGIAAYLGNNNLNNIIDTEDSGSFKMNLWFDTTIRQDASGLDNLFFWERNKNSDLGIQAIDENGNLLGNFLKLTRGDGQKDAGYQIDTTEIGAAQKVGSWGVSLKELGLNDEQASKGIKGIQVSANADYNGPDFKVIARSVPEPSTTAALALVAMSALKVLNKKRLAKV
ncbi:PEP-CTERM sorting domain-containing protein [Calothrix sp. FACHB-1219]|uniref:exosortase-dependent surface protein XDP2 n=1 Tax=unclassified Calothrix TaxID=2619626 RepID=UPI001682D2BE|nr:MULTISPECIES: exosortase-dependent surface protein XDP2 [unclassified Calothrix]MBD2206147.1 PEP-CTERM sorting domain-containing protein [Calothrix sp. FACHB-168]MBD2220992.1 PEP-CTERM sorting domain-containing protein [Calothrix sp. FACHB-1219]